jgi:hypothetical protein
MEALMQLIDKNSQLIPEGDYLKMCNILKKLRVPSASAPMFEKFDIPIEMGALRYFHDHFNGRLSEMDITFNERALDLLEELAKQMSEQSDDSTLAEKHMRVYFSIPDTVTDLHVWASEQGKNFDDIVYAYNRVENIFKDRVARAVAKRAEYFFENIHLSEDYYL